VSDQDLAGPVDEIDDGDDEAVAPVTEPGRRSAALILAITLAVVFGLAAVVLGVVAVDDDGDVGILSVERDGTDARLEEVRRTAGRFAEALVTYDYR